MTIHRAVLVACLLCARDAAAGPYMTGIGLTSLNLFPNGLFPDCSGPLLIGGGYSQGVGTGARSGGVLRFGAAMIKFDDVDTLARPAGMLALDYVVHFEDDPYFTMGINYQHGIGRLLVGGGAGVAIRETAASGDSDYALVVSPELSLPLRWRAHPRFTPSAVVFARIDVSLSGRESFRDQALAGLAFAVW